MGTIRNGGNGAFSGKAGSFIGSNWKNVDYIKGIPRLSKKPATLKQLEQRQRFAITLAFLTPIRDLVNTGYKGPAGNKSTGMNIAMNNTLSNAIVGTYPDLSIDPQLVNISKGSLQKPIGLKAVGNATGVTLSWFNNVNRSCAFADDKLYVLVYHPVLNLFLVFEDTATRGLGTVDVELPSEFVGENYLVYAFFQQRDNSRCSDSVCGILSI